MNKMLSEILKVAEAYQTDTIASTVDDDTLFFAPGLERKICFVVMAEYEDQSDTGTLLDTEEVTLSLLEATDAAGTGDRAINDRDGNPIETVIAGAVNADEVVLEHVAYLDGDEFTVNGVTFVRDALGFDADLRPFNYEDRADMILVVNNHFDGIEASAATDPEAILISSINPGEVGITVTYDIDAGAAFAASTRIVGYVDVDASQLDVANGFTHVGVNIENGSAAGDADFTAIAVLGDARYNPSVGPGR